MKVGKGQLHGFYLQVLRQRRIHASRFQIEVLQHAQGHEGTYALAAGANFVQREVAITHRDRLHPVGLVGRQVNFIDQPAGIACMVGDGDGQLAAVKVVTLAGGNTFQSARLTRADELLSRQGRTPFRRKCLAIARLRQQLGNLRLPLTVHRGRHHVAVTGVTQCRLKQFGKRDTAKAVGQGAPSRHRAGHRHRVPATRRHGLVAREVLCRPAPGRAPGGVQAMHALAVPDDGKGVAANAVHAGLDHR